MTTLKSVAIAVGLASSAFGQATSPVVGFVTEDLVTGFNPIGVTLHQPILTTGTFESELTDSEGNFSTSLDNFDEVTYLLEITSGPQSGAVAIIDSATDTTLTLSSELGAGNADYSIREAATLNDLFGGQVSGGIQPTAANVDTIFVQRLGGDGFDQYFFSTFQGANEFRLTTSAFAPAARDAVVFYPDALFIDVGDTSLTESVTIAGSLKTTGTVVSAETGFNFVAAAAPAGLTLGNSGFESFLTQSLQSTTADLVFVSTGGSNFTQYFFSSFANNPGWRLTTAAFGADQSAVPLSSAMFIQRRGASTAGVANVPPFFSSL